jgi:hypothetical protein
MGKKNILGLSWKTAPSISKKNKEQTSKLSGTGAPASLFFSLKKEN